MRDTIAITALFLVALTITVVGILSIPEPPVNCQEYRGPFNPATHHYNDGGWYRNGDPDPIAYARYEDTTAWNHLNCI